MMSIDELKRLCSVGENCEVEFKSAKGGFPKSFWETYSAFANTSGGVIILGVKQKDDEFAADGLSEAELTNLKKIFWDTAHNRSKVSHCLLTDDDVDEIDVEDGSFALRFSIPRAEYNKRPIYLTENPLGHTYKRKHEGDYICSDEEVRAFMRDADDKGNDSRHVPEYSMDEIDIPTLRAYRQRFLNRNPDHYLNNEDDKEFLRQLGGYYVDKNTGEEGLTLAGLLLFGKGLPIRERLPLIRLDYLDMVGMTGEMRYADRLTYDFSWENNLLQFFWRVMPKLKQGLKVPFVLHGDERNDDTPMFKLLREAMTNMLSHCDFLVNGVLRVERRDDGFFFSNPGTLKLEVEEIYRGGVSRARNPKIQDMLRMIGYGDNIGTGFPTIIQTWQNETGLHPILCERPEINTVDLTFAGLKRKVENTQVDTQVTTQVKNLILSIKEGRYSKSELVALHKSLHKSNKTLMDQYFTPAIEQGYVAMTIPEKKNSPKQQYYLTEKGLMLLKTLTN